MQVRTDLAEEAQALWRQSAGKTTQLEGVKARSWEEHGVGRHQVQILNEQGEKALGKPRGTYETLWVPGDGRPTPEAAEALGEAVRDLLDLRGGESVLVVGLGNRAMTPDAVGPLSAGGILVTRHLRQQLPQ
ncbi:MAG: GPR endopeptidase, partial [Oscillospiraceae bacterium]